MLELCESESERERVVAAVRRLGERGVGRDAVELLAGGGVRPRALLPLRGLAHDAQLQRGRRLDHVRRPAPVLRTTGDQ